MLLEAYIIPGIGCIFLFCLLSGCYYLQKMALTLKKVKCFNAHFFGKVSHCVLDNDSHWNSFHVY
jgi:hypothetical protein